MGLELDKLNAQDPKGDIHVVELHKGKAHWMDLEDGVAVGWMSRFIRNPIPQKLVWKQDDVAHDRFYWLGTPKEAQKERGMIVANYNKSDNKVDITKSDTNKVTIYLNANMLNLDNRVIINFLGKTVYNQIPRQTISSLYETIIDKGDKNLAFPVKIIVEK